MEMDHCFIVLYQLHCMALFALRKDDNDQSICIIILCHVCVCLLDSGNIIHFNSHLLFNRGPSKDFCLRVSLSYLTILH